LQIEAEKRKREKDKIEKEVSEVVNECSGNCDVEGV
jgi:hypothetical protein